MKWNKKIGNFHITFELSREAFILDVDREKLTQFPMETEEGEIINTLQPAHWEFIMIHIIFNYPH